MGSICTNVRTEKLNAGATRELPALEGWWTIPDAADFLGLTRKRGYQMAREGKFTTAHTLGLRPLLVVREAEVRLMLIARAKRLIKRFPGWNDDQVAARLHIPAELLDQGPVPGSPLDAIAQARRDLAEGDARVVLRA